MANERCPVCSEILGQETYIISGNPVLFWVCPDPLCGWEGEVTSTAVDSEEPEAES